MRMNSLGVLCITVSTAACSVKGNIPDLHSDALCTPGWEARLPSLCDWARSADAIVIGKVLGLSWDYEDAVSLATGGAADPACPSVTPVLWIELEVSDVISGPMRAGQRIQVMGQDSQLWIPQPWRAPDGSVEVSWPSGVGAGIVVGQQLGTVLHQEPGGRKWGTRYEPFFMEVNGGVRFSKVDNLCAFTAPVNTGDYGSIDVFAEAVAACPAATPMAADRGAAITASARWSPVCLDRESVETEPIEEE